MVMICGTPGSGIFTFGGSWAAAAIEQRDRTETAMPDDIQLLITQGGYAAWAGRSTAYRGAVCKNLSTASGMKSAVLKAPGSASSKVVAR